MFSTIYCFLAICLLGVYANDDWSYCTCMKDTKAVEGKYEERHDEYFKSVDAKRREWIDAITARVDEMHNEHQCQNTYYTKNVTEFTWEMLAICGGHALGTTYDAPWKDRPMEDEEVCSTIATTAPIMCAYIELNEKVLQDCEVSNTFDKYIWPNYNECAKNCWEH